VSPEPTLTQIKLIRDLKFSATVPLPLPVPQWPGRGAMDSEGQWTWNNHHHVHSQVSDRHAFNYVASAGHNGRFESLASFPFRRCRPGGPVPGRRPNLDLEFKFNSLAMISDSAWQLQVELEFLKFKFGIPVMMTPA
jgi:hypothetical protein